MKLLLLLLLTSHMRVVGPEPGRSGACPDPNALCVTEPTVAFSARGLIWVCREPASAALLGYSPRGNANTARGLTIQSNASSGFLRPNAPSTCSPRLTTASAPGVTAPKLHLPDRHVFQHATESLACFSTLVKIIL